MLAAILVQRIACLVLTPATPIIREPVARRRGFNLREVDLFFLEVTVES